MTIISCFGGKVISHFLVESPMPVTRALFFLINSLFFSFFFRENKA